MKRYFISFDASAYCLVINVFSEEEKSRKLFMEKWFDFFLVDWKSCWWIYEVANILLNKLFDFYSPEIYVAFCDAHTTLSIRRIHLHCACIVSVDKYAYLSHECTFQAQLPIIPIIFIELMRIAHQRYFTALCTVAQCRQCEKKHCSTAWNKEELLRDLKNESKNDYVPMHLVYLPSSHSSFFTRANWWLTHPAYHTCILLFIII